MLVSLIALGMAMAFVSADRQSPTSRALAAAFAWMGVAIWSNVVVVGLWQWPPETSRWLALPEVLAAIYILEWILRVRRMVPVAPGVNVRFGDRVLRSGQAVSVLYALFSLLWPDLRDSHFLRAASDPRLFLSAGFWLFAAPLLYAMLAGTAAMALLLNRRPERGETLRVLAMGAATPLFVAGFVLPLDAAALAVALGEIIFLIGATHYHVLQGQRGQFLSRFLSPQVARLVAERGIDRAMQEDLREITVVSCDLRGFTAYAAAHPSSRVLQVLREYYEAVGAVVSSYGGTIKDYAGDGVLILVGAPLPIDGHARCGLDMASRIRAEVLRRSQAWSVPGYPLGLGVGVASGAVTVGVIGASARLEYSAVGSPVNLASRLCEQAASGEILVDARTAELAGLAALEARAAVGLKGFGDAVPHFALAG